MNEPTNIEASQDALVTPTEPETVILQESDLDLISGGIVSAQGTHGAGGGGGAGK